MTSVLIVGASRGIGLGFTQSFAADGWEVHATTRTPENPGALGGIAGDVTIHGLEVRNKNQIESLAGVFEDRGTGPAYSQCRGFARGQP